MKGFLWIKQKKKKVCIVAKGGASFNSVSNFILWKAGVCVDSDDCLDIVLNWKGKGITKHRTFCLLLNLLLLR